MREDLLAGGQLRLDRFLGNLKFILKIDWGMDVNWMRGMELAGPVLLFLIVSVIDSE